MSIIFYKPKKAEESIWKSEKAKDLGLVAWFEDELPNVQYQIGIGNASYVRAQLSANSSIVQQLAPSQRPDNRPEVKSFVDGVINNMPKTDGNGQSLATSALTQILLECIEVSEAPIQNNQTVFPQNDGSAYSIKTENIVPQFNVSHLISILENALSFGRGITANQIVLVLIAVIKEGLDVMKLLKIPVNKEQMIVLRELYRNYGMSSYVSEEIFEKQIGSNDDIQLTTDVSEILSDLEKMKCIDIIDGKIRLIEKIALK